ncbi:hypothetical protein HDG34_003227 [Paraburkholderia sp. HC6.4b]|uniref:hypothetical protein n=1 Tax=unclassified Paraburkholderia TaxID=2615204 RepID=UPI00161E9F1C|nr:MULTISPECIES: hypothetical protein [unclassified Paraburkholderia]MBB5409286.1 hypothetical protein [Paraburkholderia sp. HC6.4b]MBB5451014.1 hypothetical protein [Paraburkholderia sp. Kb1A]
MTTAFHETALSPSITFAGMKPEDDGITHINISTSGQTALGRKLAHYSVTPFIHPVYGPFRSMEGFWYYIKCERPDDEFRNLCGSRAKAHAKTKRMVWREHFSQIINEANFYRIVQNDDIREAMIASTLPFGYYYLHGPQQLQIHSPISGWLCDGLEEIRRHLKASFPWPPAPVVKFDVTQHWQE